MELQKVEGETIGFPANKDITPCNSLEELYKFREERFKNIGIAFLTGNNVATYYDIKNPVTFSRQEIEE